MGKDRFLKILCDHPLLWGAVLFASGFFPLGTANLAIGQVPRDLQLSEFPNPPQQLQQLIAAGDVSFKLGSTRAIPESLVRHATTCLIHTRVNPI